MKKKILAINIALICLLFGGCANSSNEKFESTATEPIVIPETTTENTTATTIENTTETTTEKTTVTTTETTVETLVDPKRETVVRNVCWKDTIDIVKSLEEAEFLEEDDNILLYETYVSNYRASLMYYFDKNYGLYKTVYIFPDETGANGTLLIGQYNQLVKVLSTKYGEPTQSIKKPLDSLYDYCDSDAEALTLGSLAYTTRWELNDTNIDILLMRMNSKLDITIFFEDTSFEPPVDTSGF